jgi:broad specificity phosphatase PhoE
MLRAVETATKLTRVPPTFMPLFREIPQAPLFDTRLKMPLIVWHVLSRIGWWFNHRSQPEGRRAALKRVARIVDFLRRQPADQQVLIVTHGFLMYVLRRELKRSGFAGQIPTHPKCGEVYVFKRPAEWPAAVPSRPASAAPSPVFRWNTRT